MGDGGWLEAGGEVQVGGVMRCQQGSGEGEQGKQGDERRADEGGAVSETLVGRPRHIPQEVFKPADRGFAQRVVDGASPAYLRG